MAEALAEKQLRVPWTLRVFDAVPLSPAWTGVAIALAFSVVFMLYAWAAGWLATAEAAGRPFWTHPVFLWEILNAVMIGYLPFASSFVVRGAQSDLRDLRPVLDCTDAEFEAELRGVPAVDRGPLMVFSLLGIAVGLGMPFTPFYWAGERPPLGSSEVLWNLIRGPLVTWLGFRAVIIAIDVGLRFSRIGATWARIDLLDLSRLAPFARQGLRGVLLLVILASLLSFQALAPWPDDLTFVFVAALVAVAGATLVLPVRGVRRRIAAARAAELARVRAQIHREAASLESRSPDELRLTHLVAYEERIAGVRSWPFDLSTLLRFALYVALGLGSWLGAALVERGLGAVLD